MSNTIDISGLPSWILVLLIGLGIVFLSSNGVLTGFGGIGRLMVFGGLMLGVVYFGIDLSNKL